MAFPDASEPSYLAGVILETEDGLGFVRGRHALSVLESPRLSQLPGTPLELLWFEGHVVPAASFALLTRSASAGSGPVRDEQGAPHSQPHSEGASTLVCELEGQRLALTNVEVLATGRFVEAPEAIARPEPRLGRVRYADRVASEVDLEALFRAAAALARSEDEFARSEDETKDAAAVVSDSGGLDPEKDITP